MAMVWLVSTMYTNRWYFLGCCYDSTASPRGNVLNSGKFGVLIYL